MATYTPLARAAAKLQTTAENLRQFETLGWIRVTEKNGMAFLADNQEYKAKFILFLQRERNLNQKQISTILAAQNPPYRIADVDQVLAAAAQ